MRTGPCSVDLTELCLAREENSLVKGCRSGRAVEREAEKEARMRVIFKMTMS